MDGHTRARQVDLHIGNLPGCLDAGNLSVVLAVVHPTGLESGPAGSLSELLNPHKTGKSPILLFDACPGIHGAFGTRERIASGLFWRGYSGGIILGKASNGGSGSYEAILGGFRRGRRPMAGEKRSASGFPEASNNACPGVFLRCFLRIFVPVFSPAVLSFS